MWAFRCEKEPDAVDKTVQSRQVKKRITKNNKKVNRKERKTTHESRFVPPTSAFFLVFSGASTNQGDPDVKIPRCESAFLSGIAYCETCRNVKVAAVVTAGTLLLCPSAATAAECNTLLLICSNVRQ